MSSYRLRRKISNITSCDVNEEGLQSAIHKLNVDPDYVHSRIKFDSDISHFVDRLEEHNIHIADIVKAIMYAARHHKCQFVYYSRLDDKQLRFNIRTKSMIIGLTCRLASYGIYFFKFRTVMHNYTARHDGRVSTYFIDLGV